MKILLQTRYDPSIGGIETLSRILVQKLIEMGHDVTITTDIKNDERIRCERVVYKPTAANLLKLWHENDVVVHMNVSLKAVWPKLLSRAPCVYVHHSPYWIDRNGRRDWREKLKIWIARGNPWNICVSNFVRDAIGISTAVTVPNCYDDKMFKINVDIQRDRDIIFVGRLVSDKGVDLLLGAISKCHNRNSIKVTIVGGGPEEDALRKQVADLGLENIKFTGPLPPHLVSIELSAHRILVVPTLTCEAFGVVALEGMACGVVPVVSDGGGLPEAVGKAGITFRHCDVNDLAKQLNELIASSDKYDHLSREAKKHLEKFTAEGMCDAYMDVINKAYNA